MRRWSRATRPAFPTPVQAAGGALLAVLFALAGYALLTFALSRELGADVSAYWNAAERLRSGETLYAAGAANASDLYRYAPWFATAWVPLTYLPRDAVTAAWVGLMVAAAMATTLPLLLRGPTGWAAFAIFAPVQLQGAVFGNVQPLLVLVLLWGIERRTGPLWLALAASLKAVPIVLVLVYAGRGEWRKAALAGGFTAILVLPTLLFDLSAYSTDPGPNQLSLAGVSPWLFIPVVVAAAAASWAMARTRYAWLAGASAMVLSLPRLLDYQIGLVLVGLARPTRPPTGQAVRGRQAGR